MESKTLNQERIEPKIRVSRDSKWIIINVPGLEEPVIKPVAYFEKMIGRARAERNNTILAELERI